MSSWIQLWWVIPHFLSSLLTTRKKQNQLFSFLNRVWSFHRPMEIQLWNISWLDYVVLGHQKHITLWWGSKESLWHCLCLSLSFWNCSTQPGIVSSAAMLPFDHCLDSCCLHCLSVTYFPRGDLSSLPSHIVRCAAVTVVRLKLYGDVLWIWRDL